MIKKIAQTIFLRTRSIPRYRFSTQSNRNNQTEPKSVQQQVKRQTKVNEEYAQDEQFQYKKEDRSTKGWMIYRFFFWGTTAILGYNIYRVATHKKPQPVEKQPWVTPGFIGAAKYIYGQYTDMMKFMTKPPLEKLLSDPLHPIMQPKTLVLNVSGTLLDTEYVFGKGLVLKKRPGLQQFLNKMSRLYEVIIFSDDDSMLLETLLPSLDPRQQIISGYFGQESMVLSGRRYIKDLKYLNRQMNKIVVIDVSKQKVPKQPNNVITLSKYSGDESDRQLYSLTALLENLAKPQVADVRKTLEQLGDDPLKRYSQALKEKQEKIKESKGNKFFGFFSGKKN